MDSEKDADKIKEWGIKGFPTIVVKHKDKALEYIGPRDFGSVADFIDVISNDVSKN